MNNSGSHLSKEMLELIKSIGDARSKQEEDNIIIKESEGLKVKINQSGVNGKKMKEYLLRAIYIEMLGHDASFAQKHSLNLTQDKSILNKRVGYLACNQLLSESSEFLILLVASLQKDIQSSNWIEVCMALTSVVKFANSTIMQAATEPILKLLDHRSEQVRKKAVMCAYKFYQVSPGYIPDVDERMRRLLCDYDPSVMGASLNYFSEVCKKNPEKYKDLVSPLITILKQIIEHKLPKDYDYHRFPAPWLQVKILDILATLGRDDQSASENMYEILSQTLRRADDTGINIGYAIVYQCLRTICIIYPNQHLIELASNTISRFLSSDSPNLRCTGINGLALIIQINPEYVMNHQQIIVDCLEENDETLKKNTFDLLYRMTTMDNVEVIVDKVMNYLKNSTLEPHNRKDILYKITELTERFAPDKGWFIKIMNQLFVNFGELITNEIISKLIKLINEWESETDINEFRRFTIENYQAILENYSNLPDSLVKLIAWVVGEYGKKLYNDNEDKMVELLRMLDYLLNKTYDDDITKCMLITAIIKLHSNMNFPPLDFIKTLFEKYSKDKNVEIQQRCLEYNRLLNTNTAVFKNQFTTILDELDIDKNLNFLNDYVAERVRGGAKAYFKNMNEDRKSIFNKEEVELKVGPYATPESITSNPNKISDAMTKLFDSKDVTKRNNLTSTKITVENVKWVKGEGYINNPTPYANSSNVPKHANSASVSSASSGVSTVIKSNTGNDRFNSIKGPVLDSGKNKDEPKNIFSGISSKKKEEVVYDPKREEKEKLKGGLFGNMGKTNIQATGPNISNAISLASSIQKKNVNPTIASTKVQPQTTDLLNLGLSGMTLNSNKTTHVQQEKPKENTFNLLDEIFSSSSTPSNPITNTDTNIYQQNLKNEPSKVSTSTNGNINVLTMTSTNLSGNPSNSNNIFDIFGNKPSITTQEPSLQANFEPFNIDTDTFGEFWTSCPHDEVTNVISTKSIRTPEQYFKVISTLCNFSPIQIINNEAIASAKYKKKMVLAHTTINGDNTLEMLIKCYDKTLVEEISQFMKNVLISK